MAKEKQKNKETGDEETDFVRTKKVKTVADEQDVDQAAEEVVEQEAETAEEAKAPAAVPPEAPAVLNTSLTLSGAKASVLGVRVSGGFVFFNDGLHMQRFPIQKGKPIIITIKQ